MNLKRYVTIAPVAGTMKMTDDVRWRWHRRDKAEDKLEAQMLALADWLESRNLSQMEGAALLASVLGRAIGRNSTDLQHLVEGLAYHHAVVAGQAMARYLSGEAKEHPSLLAYLDEKLKTKAK
jgi:hypothetical protein